MNGSIKGIVIRATDYREKDKILDIFTRYGVIPFIAKGVRTPLAKLKNLSNILIYGDFFYQTGRMGRILSGGEILESFYPCWIDPKKYASAMICFELAEKLYKKEEDLSEEFIIVMKSIKEIAYGNDPLATALWYCVKCAEKAGVDFSCLSEHDPDTYQLLITSLESTESGVVGAKEVDIFVALKTLMICFKNEYGISLRSIRDAEKLFYNI